MPLIYCRGFPAANVDPSSDINSTLLTIHSNTGFTHRVVHQQEARSIVSDVKLRRRGMHSDIHVVVRFHGQSVFAGEELRCTITFKNVATSTEPVSPPLGTGRGSRRESISQIAAQVNRSNASARLNQNGRVRGNNDDFTEPAGGQRASASHRARSPDERQTHPRRPTHQHQRSVSIMSVTSPIASGDVADNGSSWARQQRLGHQRTSTVSTPQRRRGNGHSRRESPAGSPVPPKGGRRSPLFQNTSEDHNSTIDFRFPSDRDANKSPTSTVEETLKTGSDQLGHTARIISGTKQVASERSSGDFYSLSNHSQETLTSEQPSILSDHRPLFDHSSPLPRRGPQKPLRKPQAVNLLMGYAQLSASFTLDASLIDQAHFEEVKSKGFLGGQAGGGVVGMKKPRPHSGFLGNFSLNNIGESLNSLLNGEDMSSVREMDAMKNSRAIPLLSTPQSLLFVDMHLEPGEEQSYSFVYPLPRGLPSSHRGKAIKISYNLTIGVQGLPGSRDVHTVRQVNIPVRVFSGVNYDGEIFGHDLMQPHVVLRDMARTKSISSPDNQEEVETPRSKSDAESTAEFLQFVDGLLDRNRRRQSSSGTMDAATLTNNPDAQNQNRAIQAINRAILFSNQLAGGESSPNRFEITRNGQRVAVIVIDRPLHRLGETVTAVIDFTDGHVPCASLRSTLETCEKVSPSLAVRSAATINRVTRKIYWGCSDNVLFTKRASFTPSIPASATPTFTTSGVNLEWSLRFEFGTIKPIENDEGELKPTVDLLEEVIRDERGAINVAVENLECETFEVVIPITVYGDVLPDSAEGAEIVAIPV
ncbi:Golgi membrane exchange factor (Ric1p-Rgp1p) subunit [Exophiala dermatitidis]|nr:Golgi membrane exchange factor (Ric1p-Rgp1p) subunit [Exophiala dermatitidis]KAJ4553053.1 Golgi membrane exchange factor (Ric1p-Rgp1p) subunit [Exophiala dermatitidis]